jgi:hypothetical protein
MVVALRNGEGNSGHGMFILARAAGFISFRSAANRLYTRFL